MDNISRFGVFLPTYIWDDDGPERARNIVAFAKRVEELGFDSLWVTDHLLSAQHFYSASFLEPLSTLAVAAGATERVRLGTSVLVLPTRQPVVLAKELSTLQYLSDNRFILGAGVGWNQAEFRATGGDKSQRGRRTDEILDIAIPLMEGETVTYHGKYFQVDEVSIEPRPTRRPELWIGGGSQLANEKSPDKPMLVPAVKERILKAEGWIPRPTCPPEDQARDWEEIQDGMRERGRDLSQFTVAHENFMHFVDTNDPRRGAPRAARGVPEGDERDARPGVPGVGLPVRHARGDRRPAAGPRGRRHRLPDAAHDDAGHRAAGPLGARHRAEREVPGACAAGPVTAA